VRRSYDEAPALEDGVQRSPERREEVDVLMAVHEAEGQTERLELRELGFGFGREAHRQRRLAEKSEEKRAIARREPAARERFTPMPRWEHWAFLDEHQMSSELDGCTHEAPHRREIRAFVSHDAHAVHGARASEVFDATVDRGGQAIVVCDDSDASHSLADS
jgi:hypothetical protein